MLECTGAITGALTSSMNSSYSRMYATHLNTTPELPFTKPLSGNISLQMILRFKLNFFNYYMEEKSEVTQL